ncbi:hypothetical protein K1Y37_01495 [Serratia marcescens]|uniref:hypothetical protein n=1 Tax=Serratia marcescens TaxID=615 RepID=UPI002237CB75|nr:hypothetical protein [Serratia marcescens]MCW6021646.1 hypothetical protein [Serratia marcescens]
MYDTRFAGCFFIGGFSLMLRRYLFEIVLTALILCGLIAVFFLPVACRVAGGKLLKNQLLPIHMAAKSVYS